MILAKAYVDFKCRDQVFLIKVIEAIAGTEAEVLKDKIEVFQKADHAL